MVLALAAEEEMIAVQGQLGETDIKRITITKGGEQY